MSCCNVSFTTHCWLKGINGSFDYWKSPGTENKAHCNKRMNALEVPWLRKNIFNRAKTRLTIKLREQSPPISTKHSALETRRRKWDKPYFSHQSPSRTMGILFSSCVKYHRLNNLSFFDFEKLSYQHILLLIHLAYILHEYPILVWR